MGATVIITIRPIDYVTATRMGELSVEAALPDRHAIVHATTILGRDYAAKQNAKRGCILKGARL